MHIGDYIVHSSVQSERNQPFLGTSVNTKRGLPLSLMKSPHKRVWPVDREREPDPYYSTPAAGGCVRLLPLRRQSQAQPQPEYPTFDPTLADYDNIGAILLAEEVKGKYGGESWNDSVLISFDFVTYNRDGKEMKRYTNAWNRMTDEAVLAGALDDGRPFRVRFSSLSGRKGTMQVDSVDIDSAYLQEGLDIAYERLRNNFFWLLMPLDLLDTNYSMAMLADTVIGGIEYIPMHVVLNDSTISMTDVLLYIHKAHKQIERWRINYEGIVGEYIWRRTRKVGSLVFSSRHWSADYNYYIQLERVRVRHL